MTNGNEAIQAGVEHAQATMTQAKSAMDQAAGVGNAAFKDSMEKSMQALNDINAQSKRNLEAMVASVTAATKGAEALGAQVMAYTKKAMEGQAEAAKTLSGARSVQEVIELQTGYAKTAMDGYIAEMNRASETVANAVKESMRPLNERASALVETMQSAR